MKILTDIHTHTIASTHAYSTIRENALAAAEKGLELIAMTDHAPLAPDSPHLWHFENSGAIPPVICGVKILKGAELNVLNKRGETDIPERILKRLGIILASIHYPIYEQRDEADHTKTWLNVMDNPYIDVLGHIGRNGFSFDHKAVIKKAKKKDILIEVNRYTLLKDFQTEICRDIILCCKKYGAKICVGSDAHYCDSVGDFEDAINLLKDCDFPEELIISRDAKTLIDHLKNKKPYLEFNF